MNLKWFAKVIIHHPFIILSVVAVFTGTCVIIPLALKSMPFPNFQDPQMGFSTRGTTISNRLTAWSNLVKMTKPSGDFTANPSEFLEIRNKNYSSVSYRPHKKNEKKKKLKSGPVYGNVYVNEMRNLTDTKTDIDRWNAVKMLTLESNKNTNSGLIKRFFCDSPDDRYAHLVVSSDDKRDLFTIGNMLAMCRLEHEFIALQHYKDLCIQNTKGKSKCCKPWSLPNYIAVLSNRASCLAITEEDVASTKQLLTRCSQYFFSMELNVDCLKTTPYCRVPMECIRHEAVFNMFNFLTSIPFLSANHTEPGSELTEAMIFLPLAGSTAILPYYHELEKQSLEYDGVKVVAMDFGIKNALFDEYLIEDTRLMGAGAAFIFICMWLYTQSLFLTAMAVFIIVFSLAISYFMYFFVFEIKFFPFMNMLAAIVAIGIGSDDAFIFCKIWNIQKQNQENSLCKRMTDTLQHVSITMSVTAITTTVAFLGSYISSVTAISCFSIFAGTAIIVNYFLMMTWFPACIVIWERSCLSNAEFYQTCVLLCIQKWCCYRPNWNLSSSWYQCALLNRIWRVKEEILLHNIIKFKYFWFFFLISLSIISGVIVFYYPKLQLPDTNEFQMFDTYHPFEQYDFHYKYHFWFNKPEIGTIQVYSGNKLPLRFVWGVLPIDNGDHLDPLNLGTLILDPDFDMANPEAQDWLLNFCQKLRLQPFYYSMVGPLLPNCFVETFVKSMKRKCYSSIDGRNRWPCCELSTFPFNRTVFEECVIEEMAEIYETPSEFLSSGMAGPKFSKDQFPIIKAVIIEYDSSYSYSMSYEQMHTFYKEVENWMAHELKTAPETMKKGWFISELGFYDLQRELSESTVTAIIMSMGLALVVLFLSTLNPLTSLFAIVTITSSILVTMAALVMLGWRMNVLESIAVSLAVGLVVDFSLHYSVNYRLCPEVVAESREAATRYALSYMAGPSLMAAITTGAAGGFMLPSRVLAYIQIGKFLVIVMFVSWVYATFLLGSMLAIAGPVNNCCQFSYSMLKCCSIKAKDTREAAPPTQSSVSGSHELESLTLPKRERQTPRPLRRSLSSGGARYTPSKYMSTDQSPSATSAITIIMPDEN